MCRAAGYRSTGRAGCGASPVSCCRWACSPASSGGSSWRRSPTPTRQAGSRSSARSGTCVAARPSTTSRTAQTEELVRLHQAALHRAGGGSRLSRPLHPPCRHLEQSPRFSRPTRCELPPQGLPLQSAGTVRHNDTQRRRVHQALPAARSAKGVPSHRHYGLLASATCKANIARARELIAASVAVTDPPAAR